jgi:hypothetical protein
MPATAAPAPPRARTLLDRLAETDFSTGRPALVLAAAFLAVRLPLLGGGYGTDTDAYRVVLAARYLWSHGEYLPSRLPGFPLHELVTALLIWGGPLVTNLATALAALAGVLVFARLARRLRVPAPGLAVLGFAFTPYLIVTSTGTLDYHWALTALLTAYLLTVQGRPRAAGLLVGLAVGFRITSALFLLPLLLLLLRQGRRRDAVHLAATALITAFVAYLPVAIPYRFRFLDYADSRVSPDGVIRVVGQWALGAMGALAVLAAVALSWRRVLMLPRAAARDPHLLAWLLAVALWTAAFLRLPVDLGYLVPVYPFGFLLLAVTLRRTLFAAVLAVILLAGFVDLDIQQLHNFDPRIAIQTVRPSWRVAGLPSDQIARRRWVRYARAIPEAPVPEHSVVLTMGAFPDVAVLNWSRLRYAVVERDRRAISMLSDNGSLTDPARDVVYLAVSTPDVLARFRARGYALFRADPVGPGWERAELTPLP